MSVKSSGFDSAWGDHTSTMHQPNAAMKILQFVTKLTTMAQINVFMARLEYEIQTCSLPLSQPRNIDTLRMDSKELLASRSNGHATWTLFQDQKRMVSSP